jgi:Ca2+-binding EF-hand superfamily protein
MGVTFCFMIGAVTEAYLESAFLVFSGLGFIPGLMGTISQSLETVIGLIGPNIGAIQSAFFMAKDFLVGMFAGAAGLLGFSACSVIGGAKGMLGGAGAMAKNIALENLDTGKVNDDIDAAGDEPSKKWKQRVRAVYDEIDSDGDGILQRKEIQDVMKSKKFRGVFIDNDVLMSKAMFDKFFAAIDRNHDGVVDFEEFVYAIHQSDPHWHGDEHDNTDSNNVFPLPDNHTKNRSISSPGSDVQISLLASFVHYSQRIKTPRPQTTISSSARTGSMQTNTPRMALPAVIPPAWMVARNQGPPLPQHTQSLPPFAAPHGRQVNGSGQQVHLPLEAMSHCPSPNMYSQHTNNSSLPPFPFPGSPTPQAMQGSVQPMLGSAQPMQGYANAQRIDMPHVQIDTEVMYVDAAGRRVGNMTGAVKLGQDGKQTMQSVSSNNNSNNMTFNTRGHQQSVAATPSGSPATTKSSHILQRTAAKAGMIFTSLRGKRAPSNTTAAETNKSNTQNPLTPTRPTLPPIQTTLVLSRPPPASNPPSPGYTRGGQYQFHQPPVAASSALPQSPPRVGSMPPPMPHPHGNAYVMAGAGGPPYQMAAPGGSPYQMPGTGGPQYPMAAAGGPQYPMAAPPPVFVQQAQTAAGLSPTVANNSDMGGWV